MLGNAVVCNEKMLLQKQSFSLSHLSNHIRISYKSEGQSTTASMTCTKYTMHKYLTCAKERRGEVGRGRDDLVQSPDPDDFINLMGTSLTKDTSMLKL